MRARTELLLARRIALPVQRLRLAAGRSGTVRVRVPSRVRRQLEGRRTLTARLSLAVRSAGGRTTRDTMTTRIRLRR